MSAPRPIQTPPQAFSPLMDQQGPAAPSETQNVVSGHDAHDSAETTQARVSAPAACEAPQPTLPEPRVSPRAIMTLLRQGPVRSHKAAASLTTPEMEARLTARGEAMIAKRDSI